MKLAKKIISAVTSLACVAGMLSAIGTNTFAAEELTYDIFSYVNQGTYIEITDCDYETKMAVVPSEIDGLPVTTIGKYAFSSCSDLVSVEIPDSVTTIGGHAFFSCFKLKNVSMTDSVTKIGESAFFGCETLINIKLSDNITELSDMLFGDCVNLKRFNIPSKATTIGHHFLTDNKNLCAITIPENITKISNDAFECCESLNRIIIENPNCTVSDSQTTICNGWVYEGDVADHAYFNGTIYGLEGSEAQAYANEYGYRFATIGSAYLGDITDDGIINLYDAIEIAEFVMGMRTFTEAEVSAADYNNDGNTDLYDIIGIAREIM